jgi:DNA-binding Lrp family transcriptional regulator
MTVKAYIMMNAKSGTEDEICKELVEFEEVEGVATIYGQYDVIIKVAAEDMPSLDDFILNKLRGIPNIILTATMIINKEYR